jgi:hypothetical protein
VAKPAMFFWLHALLDSQVSTVTPKHIAQAATCCNVTGGALQL